MRQCAIRHNIYTFTFPQFNPIFYTFHLHLIRESTHSYTHTEEQFLKIYIRTFTFVTYCNYILFNALNASCELLLFRILRASSIIIKLVVENIRYRFFTRFFSAPLLVILIDSPKKYRTRQCVPCHSHIFRFQNDIIFNLKHSTLKSRHVR